MRTLAVAEGTGVVVVDRGRARVTVGGRYLGHLVRLPNRRWHDPTRPLLHFPGPAQAAEDMIEARGPRALARARAAAA